MISNTSKSYVERIINSIFNPLTCIFVTMIRIGIKKHKLHFLSPAGTSRGILQTKPSWFITMIDTEKPLRVGYGECSIIPGLSYDDIPGYEKKLISSYRK